LDRIHARGLESASMLIRLLKIFYPVRPPEQMKNLSRLLRLWGGQREPFVKFPRAFSFESETIQMTVIDDLTWFKREFGDEISPTLHGTPISIDFVCALAFQESGELWRKMRHNRSRTEILRLSVGDTLDAPNRSAFPINKLALLAAPRGQEMFELAHRLLGEMAAATGIEIYQTLAQRPEKFLRGYGLFQYDLQYFREDPTFFLRQEWSQLGSCLEKLLHELRKALRQLDYTDKSSLTDRESAFVGIVYNAGFGNFDERRGLQQGHNDGTHFYGENIYRYMQLIRSVSIVPASDPDPTTISLKESIAMGVPEIVKIAKREFANYNGIDEADEPLRSRIADYYEAGGGSRNLDPTRNENAWSAAFVSYCVRQSGATPNDFRFSLSHSVFVKRAIANNEANIGTFLGHRISQYAPKLGDIIHHNRDGGSLDFDFAAAHSGYPSHSAIVVDFETRDGRRVARTIGGNESIRHGSGTVGTKHFALTETGLLDQQSTGPALICIIENRIARTSAFDGVSDAGRYVVNVRSDLSLRGGPGTDFKVLSTLVPGKELHVIEFTDTPSGKWALVDADGDGRKDGFVYASFLERAPVQL
jgi:hypothetical protein